MIFRLYDITPQLDHARAVCPPRYATSGHVEEWVSENDSHVHFIVHFDLC